MILALFHMIMKFSGVKSMILALFHMIMKFSGRNR